MVENIATFPISKISKVGNGGREMVKMEKFWQIFLHHKNFA